MKLFYTAIVVLLFATQASACGFRLSDGKLLRCGMTRIDVLSLAGEPVAKDVETLGVDIGEPVKGTTVETWSYRLKGDIGGEYLVSLTLKGGKVSAIDSRQLNRI